MKKALLIASLALLVSCSKKDEKPTEKPTETKKDTVAVVPEKVYPKQYVYTHDSLLNSLSVGERWSTYKSSRAESKTNLANKEYKKAIDNLLLAGETTIKLERPDIAAWQFNNAGKSAIDLFSDNVSYKTRVTKINSMPRGDEKTAYLKECQEAYKKELELLIYGELYLDLAESLNEEDYNKSRFSAISNNKQFIKEIKSFTEKEF